MTVEEFKEKHINYYNEEWKFKESHKQEMTYTNGMAELIFVGKTYRESFVTIEKIQDRESWTKDIEIVEDKIRGTIIIVEIG